MLTIFSLQSQSNKRPRPNESPSEDEGSTTQQQLVAAGLGEEIGTLKYVPAPLYFDSSETVRNMAKEMVIMHLQIASVTLQELRNGIPGIDLATPAGAAELVKKELGFRATKVTVATPPSHSVNGRSYWVVLPRGLTTFGGKGTIGWTMVNNKLAYNVKMVDGMDISDSPVHLVIEISPPWINKSMVKPKLLELGLVVSSFSWDGDSQYESLTSPIRLTVKVEDMCDDTIKEQIRLRQFNVNIDVGGFQCAVTSARRCAVCEDESHGVRRCPIKGKLAEFTSVEKAPELSAAPTNVGTSTSAVPAPKAPKAVASGSKDPDDEKGKARAAPAKIKKAKSQGSSVAGPSRSKSKKKAGKEKAETDVEMDDGEGAADDAE